MKGIVLAGGSGSRLGPMAQVISKQLLPIYDKPMVYYPVTTLMLAGIREMLIISTPRDRPRFEELLGDGSQWGVRFQYAEQARPEGIAQALLIGRTFVAAERFALILGDNIFYGAGLASLLQQAAARTAGATIFAYRVKDPERYGVVTLDTDGKPTTIVEKPQKPLSPWAISGLYFYDHQAVDIAAGLRPSQRGELEISDVNRAFLRRGQLQVELLGRGFAWLDAGTPSALHDASQFVEIIEQRQGRKIACPEEIAWSMGFIDARQLQRLADRYASSAYGEYLARLLRGDRP
jgi:glucose-1-phosphate thymidylyltransferase